LEALPGPISNTDNGPFEIAQHAMVANQTKAPTVAAVIQEHIDLLVRPSVGTVHTYLTMLKTSHRGRNGAYSSGQVGYRHLSYWNEAMQTKRRSAMAIKNNHGLS
jgi:hypothetical protein